MGKLLQLSLGLSVGVDVVGELLQLSLGLSVGVDVVGKLLQLSLVMLRRRIEVEYGEEEDRGCVQGGGGVQGGE